MKSMILGAVALMVSLYSASTLAQSQDPQKRAQWQNSMSRCLEGMEQRTDELREIYPEICKRFADQEIRDTTMNRMRAFLSSKDTRAEPVPDEILEYRANTEDFDNEMLSQQIASFESHVRFTIYEECLLDPAKISLSDCNKIAGVDRLLELNKTDEASEEQ
jgi:hypothetical protein